MELINTVTTYALCGVIWVVHAVHYPTFYDVAPDRWRAFHARHTAAISRVVVPLMLGELIACLVLAVSGETAGLFYGLQLALVGVAWVSTFAWQVPCHRRLAEVQDPHVIRRLIVGNRLRTAAWSLKGLLLALGPSLF